MAVEKNEGLLPVWGCVDLALSFTAFAAFLGESKSKREMTEDIAEVDSQECRDQLFGWFANLVPLGATLAHYETAFGELPTDSLTRTDVRECAFAALHAAAVPEE